MLELEIKANTSKRILRTWRRERLPGCHVLGKRAYPGNKLESNILDTY
jgi:hypothetical protein